METIVNHQMYLLDLKVYLKPKVDVDDENNTTNKGQLRQGNVIENRVKYESSVLFEYWLYRKPKLAIAAVYLLFLIW